MSESRQETAIAQPSGERNFVIPGCAVTIVNQEDDGVAIEQLLGIVFSLSASNPKAKVDFWIKVTGNGN